MAIDFDKIWASTSPLTPYEFTEANYKSGWNFIGATPPSRQMWDFLQKNNDEKMQYLANNYLPLSGGTMTGNIRSSSNDIFVLRKTDNLYGIQLWSGTAYNDGASISLYGKGHSQAGVFNIGAYGENISSLLHGEPNGTLTWGGKNVERANASGTNYIRYEIGLQICWGEMSVAGTAVTDGTVTFPQPFATASSYQIATSRTWAYQPEDYFIKTASATGFTWSTSGTVSSNNHGYRYIAIGFWK